jgi:hypothetical protein
MVSTTVYFTFLVAALSSLVSAAPRPKINDAPADVTAGRRRGCGVHIDEARVMSLEKKYQAHRLPPESENSKATLDIYFHIIYANQTLEGGYLPDEQIHAQVARLNEDYNSTGITWNLKDIDRVENEEWFLGVAPEGESEVQMKTTYRKGDKATLNVYTTALAEGDAAGILGYATFPMDFDEAKAENDGVVLLHTTLPGSQSKQYNMGRTLVHEAGHWAGLYHTFQGGCKGPGDEVDDTPPEESAAYGCMEKRDTCPGNGPDPVHNFMDYSDDACMKGFTPGQAKRMRGQLRTYRGVDFK